MESVRYRYVKGFTRLSLWYVWRLARTGAEPFADVVNKRVNIYRNTSFYDGKHHPSRDNVGPVWAAVVDRLAALCSECKEDAATDGFEVVGLNLLWPFLEARLKKGGDGPAGERPYECWSYDYTGSGRLNIHIDNVYRPRSPLSEMFTHFAASLIRMLLDSLARRPEITMVRCSSWMNSTPRFRSLFPQRWPKSAVMISDIGYTMGHWGQFMDRRGDFHVTNGERFRATGTLPYAASSCECGIIEALDHLTGRFPEAVAYNRRRTSV
jgi:hypothetical protein